MLAKATLILLLTSQCVANDLFRTELGNSSFQTTRHGGTAESRTSESTRIDANRRVIDAPAIGGVSEDAIRSIRSGSAALETMD